MKTLQFTAAMSITAADQGQQSKPKRFSILAYSGGLLNVDGFPFPVVVDLAGLVIDHNIPILVDHTKSVEATLGLTDSIVNDGKSLVLSGAITGQSSLCQQVIAQAAAGHTWQASIGALVTDSYEIQPGQTVEVNSQTFTVHCRKVRIAEGNERATSWGRLVNLRQSGRQSGNEGETYAVF